MSNIWQDIQYKMLRSGSKLNLLIGINIVIFLVVSIPGVIEQLFFGSNLVDSYSTDYLSLPAYLPKLLTRFWTPFTYMFMHAGIFHILFNMLWLYWFGQIFEEYLGKKRTLGLYILGGLSGAFLFLLAFNTIPAFTHTHAANTAVMVGASASVMAVIVATATLLPDYTIPLIFIGPVRLKWLAIFFVVIDFLGITGLNAGGEISHLGGALFGYVYVVQLQKGSDWIGNIGKLFKTGSKLKIAAKNISKDPSARPRQEDVDLILDKISRSGYDSLSKQEKEILFRASNNEG
ncbi:MAG: rhomboid family intrarane serine protease [Mucilaginibacter sp.]|jgi:membrane associated rhomboid family serine protease|nr:rhomboid family intrarane serine protease [Mucilaginibacter sp.]